MTDDESMRNSNTYFKDFAMNQDSPDAKGKEMTAGLFRMMAGKDLQYTYTYEEMKYIVEGVFHITDGTGQKVVAKRGDLVYFPDGCQVTFSTPHYGLGCFTGQRKEGEEAPTKRQRTEAANPPLVHYPQITSKDLPKMTDDDEQKNPQSYFEDIAQSSVEGKEMVSGLYQLRAGNAMKYTYTYEEMKFIVEGVFHLEDGTGQKVVAKAGDLMYFPKGCQVTFATPHYALGCFTGQRKWGEA
jgi:ethanolamine utilization protein EutQ (cupin superfamily)